MRNFVTGLVRRGAGLPAPITIRPAGFKHMSLSPDMAEANPDSTPAAPITNSARITATGFPTADYPRPDAAIEQRALGVTPQHRSPPAVTAQQTSVQEVEDVSVRRGSPGLAAQSIASRAQHSDEDHAPSRRVEPAAELSPAPAIALALPAPQLRDPATSRASQCAGKSGDAVESSQRKHESPVEKGPATELLPIRVIPRQETPAQLRPAARAFAAAPNAQGKASEQRSIQVKIGRVEIRSTQPAPPVRAARRQPAAGFSDLTLARTHLDRSGW